MHEISLASAVIEQLKQLAAERPGQRITALWLAWSEFQQINETALREAFGILTADGPLAGVRLELNVEQARGRCCQCHQEFVLNQNDYKCPSCQATRFDLVADKPLTIEQIEVDEITDGDA